MSELALDNQILAYLKCNIIENSEKYAQQQNLSHEEVEKRLKSLNSEDYVNLEILARQLYVLSDEGQKFAEQGAPEFQLFKKIPAEGIDKNELQQQNPEIYQFGFQNGVKKLFKLDMGKIVKIVENAIDETQNYLKNVDKCDEETIKNLKKRQLVVQKTIKFYKATKGSDYAEQREQREHGLSHQMIITREYQNKKFKKYNWNCKGKVIETGNLHPMMKIREQFTNVFVEMGFQEMPTNRFVESSFWNFDTLFVPQNHPARDQHDTFFCKDLKTRVDDKQYWEAVKKVHSEGGFGSIGYKSEWSEAEANKIVLRTHTTAISVNMLKQLANDYQKTGVFLPKKYFSIDRVFRNETLDATHLAEFHQIEGVVADKNIGLAHLIGVIKEFFSKIGIINLSFKPAYNPYTEPSLEIFGYHPQLKKMVEIGNSGVFRPEMLRPMGLPEDVVVLGWGLGLDRAVMIQYGYNNIRDLIGHVVQLKLLKENSIACFK